MAEIDIFPRATVSILSPRIGLGNKGAREACTRVDLAPWPEGNQQMGHNLNGLLGAEGLGIRIAVVFIDVQCQMPRRVFHCVFERSQQMLKYRSWKSACLLRSSKI